MNNSSRNIILEKIRIAQSGREAKLPQKPDEQSPVFKEIQPSQAECFKREMETVSGKCSICQNEEELLFELVNYLREQNIEKVFCTDEKIISLLDKKNIAHTTANADFTEMQVAITDCELLVARTGSVVVSAAGAAGRQLNIFPPIHIVIARKEHLVNYPEDALHTMQKKYGEVLPSMISFISGPSRTADIEKTLVLGAHGPKALFVLIY